MDEMNLADLVREISRSVQQTVSNNSKTFVEIRRTVDSTVKEIKDTVLETVDTVKNTAARPKTPPKPAPYQPQWVDGKLMKRSAPGKITAHTITSVRSRDISRNFFNIGACICWATWTSATTHNLIIRNIITYIYYFLICN